MNFSTLAPFIGALIRHALVGGGLVELSKADDVSNQLASALVVVSGIAWSFYQKKKQQPPPPPQ